MRRIEVCECVELECADGKWRTVHAMPWGMTTTGQRRVTGYALTDGSTSFGTRRATREEAQAEADASNARLAEAEKWRLELVASIAAERQAAAKEAYIRLSDRGRIDSLYGPSNAPARAEILSALRGEYVPKSKAAWSVFREAMFTLFGVTGDCLAHKEHNLTLAANPNYDREQEELLAKLAV